MPTVPPAGQPHPAVPQRTEDERVDPRINLSITGCIRTPQHGEDVVITENLSDGGACFMSPNQYAGGAVIGVAIPYLNAKANVFVQARITWSRYRADQKLTAYGLAYVHARRRARRVRPTEPIIVAFIGSGIRSAGKVADLSMTGVLVRCSEPFAVGTVVRMGIGMGQETIRMVATAKRYVQNVGTAFEFTQMAHRDRSVLRRLILRIEKQ